MDACQSGGPVGRIHRLHWPFDTFAPRYRSSSHALSLVDTLRLAETLGKLSLAVTVFAVEIGAAEPAGDALSGEVAATLGELEQQLWAELAGTLGSSSGFSPDGE